MSINSILGNALSGLNASQLALRSTSTNISNVNTPAYARSQANITSRNVVGAGLGVDAASLTRITDRFLFATSLSANGDAAAGEAKAGLLDRVQAQFGTLDDPGSLFARLNTAFAEIGSAALDPASGVRRLTAVSDVQFLFDEFTRLQGELLTARSEAQRQIGFSIERANALISEISSLNGDITRGRIQGDATGAENRQDALITELSSLIDIKVDRTADGGAVLRTSDGILLLGQFPLTIEGPGAGPGNLGQTFAPIQGRTPSGNVIELQSHFKSGTIRGYLDLRDRELPALTLELAEFAAGAADALNAAHANASAVPAPTTLQGRNTGLLSADALNFTGKTSLALTDTAGALVRRVDIDFDAGTLSVDGGAPTAFGATVGGITTALNTALGALGSASFTNGKLSLSATGTNGVSLVQDATTPSDRAGRGFAHFFGLNALVTSALPTQFETGLSGTDAHGLAGGGSITFNVTGPDGRTAATINVPVTGVSINDYLAALNNTTTGVGRFVTFSLDASGRLVQTPTVGAENYQVEPSADSTARGTTGLSFTQLFGLGEGVLGTRGAAFAVRSDIANNPDKLAMAKLELTTTTAIGDVVLGSGDGRGGEAIASALSKSRLFQNAGSLSGVSSTLSDFSGRFATDVGSRASRAARQSDAAISLRSEAEQRLANKQGVNIDEELALMTQYQQSYNASARLIQAAKELTDTLLSII
ncbi:MAG: flagellar basal body rod C-terminal domain-containing protein [Robiginitomaculum sp.]|nr:flagellar basal body rod C-terminal domain-containing protein [Robiginitomaculum sp.]MDQ7076542.1 flagellar basal body rod C-terminal domain-containing protein [Robiginitomaculum sp.]